MGVSRLRHASFPLFAWGLVLHSLAIAALVGALGFSIGQARAIAAWKEVLLFLVVLAVSVRAALRKSPGAVITPTDLYVGGLIATALAYFVAANEVFRAGLPDSSQLYGFRDAVYFMLAYFIGRSIPGLVADDVVIRRLFILTIIVCAIGILERLFVSPDMLVALGIAAYFQEFLGVSEFTAGNAYGLPMNYWTEIGGVPVRRAGSVFLNGQGFAVPLLLLFPLSLAWVFHRGGASAWKVLALALITIGLLLSLTRATIAVVFVQIVLFVALKRRPEWALPGLALGTLVFVIALATIPGTAAFVWDTITWQESSAAGHAAEWGRGVMAVFEQPWGWGLGTADQTAVRAGLYPITGDNLYLKYAVEMGMLGIGLLLAILASIGRAGYRLFSRSTTSAQQRFGLIVLLATIGIALNGMTGVVFNSVPLSWMYFCMAGAAVTLMQRTEMRSA